MIVNNWERKKVETRLGHRALQGPVIPSQHPPLSPYFADSPASIHSTVIQPHNKPGAGDETLNKTKLPAPMELTFSGGNKQINI